MDRSVLHRARRIDVAIAAVVTVVAQAETWTADGYDPRPAYAAAALAMTVPLAWRRVVPLAVLPVVMAPLVAMAAAGHPLDSSYVMAVLLLAFHAIGAYCGRRRALGGLIGGLAVLAAVLVVEEAALENASRSSAIGDFVFLAVILGAVWALAVGLRERSVHARELEEHADLLERDRERRAREAVAEERARIARELHDVVAHSISVIAVQTGTLRRRLRHDRPQAAEELSEVELAAREALGEMRRLLGLLRTEEDGLTLAPQPGMEQVDRLAEQVRRTGLPVELEVDGEARSLPPGVDLAAYRIVQEALTNVLKHAGAARARVAVRYGARELELEITDDGRGPVAEANGGGHGLVGMRERVALYGGSLEIGAGPAAGFRIRARLPLGSA